jgi:transcriptional regulator of arginine metabolism
LKIVGTVAGLDTVVAICPDNEAAAEVSELISDVCRARTRPAGNTD